MATITGANSSFILSVAGVFLTPQIIQEYAADDAFTQEAFDLTETRMGADAHLTGGYVPSPKRLSVMLMADSTALDTFLIWKAAIEAAKETFPGRAVIALPSINKAFTFNRVFFKNTGAMPSFKKVLEPVVAVLEYQDLTSAPI